MKVLYGLLLAALATVHVSGTKYFLTVPKVPSYDSNFTAVVTAFQHNAAISERVLLEYRGQKTSKVLNSTYLDFDKDGSKNWTVVFSSQLMQDLGESMIILHMSCKTHQKEIVLTFRQSSGYIFIQTDKPLYAPGQTVKFRVIAVDEDQRLSKHQLKVDIINNQQVTIDRMRYSAEDAFKGQNFELPKDMLPGIWYISANFEGLDSNFRLAHNVSFEVKEYVLPRFSASLHINTSVITRDVKAFKLTVTSKYVYGRPLNGKVEIQLGTWSDNKLTQIDNAVFKGELREGHFDQDVPASMLPLEDLSYTKNQRLFVTVNVIEMGTLENFTLTDASTFIAHPYYELDFSSSKKYFKPGFSYTLETIIKTKAILKKSQIDLEIHADFFNTADELISTITDSVPVSTKPIVTYSLLAPSTAGKIKFRVHVVDENHPSYEYFTLNVSKLESANREFLQIVTAKVMRFDDGVIVLNYTKPTETDMSDQNRNLITVTILTRGLVVFSTNVNKSPDGTSFVFLPKALYRELSPTYRVVAYYYVSRVSQELVADSLLVDVEDICLEEVVLFRQGFSFASPVPLKPKEKFGFNIVGTANMKVGLVAVDKAIFLLNDRQTLTRKLLFHQLGSHDSGINVGDGKNSESIIANSGLKQMMIDTDDYSTYDTTHRVLNSFNVHLSSFEAGLPGVFHSESSPQERIVSTDEISLDDDLLPPHPQGVELPSSLPGSHIRSNFPESWLFEEKILPSSGRMSLHVWLPDPITTWSFVAVGISANRGICVSEPLEQEVQKPFFVDIRMPFKASRLEEINVKVVVHNYQTNDLRAEVVFVAEYGICIVANSARGVDQSSTSFHLEVARGHLAERTVKVIPLKIGELPIKVAVVSHLGTDTVEKKLRVVAEGEMKEEVITFFLDPYGYHATYKNERNNKITLTNTATITNEFFVSKNIQLTTVDLALPDGIIKGTESCRISAFGDLMGDIITHAVVQSKGLMEEPTFIAQEVLNDLGPIVHALNYINSTNLMTDDLRERSHRFIRHGVTRLLSYKIGNAFSVMPADKPAAKPATWLTSLILKSLCHAKNLAFIDSKNLIDAGFSWLQSQIKHDGSLNEQDWTGRKNNLQQRIELAAEALISVLECNRNYKEDHLTLQDKMADFLHKNMHKIRLPVVMAKTAYALLLYSPHSTQTQKAVRLLAKHAVNNSQGHIYWREKQKQKQESQVHWYQDKVPESWIEATAYSLLVFLQKKDLLNVDAVADWLVAQRKYNGAFNGAKDSTAAIQALTKYSLMKHQEEEIKVDMNLTIRAGRTDKNKYTFKFTQKNATQPESRNNVPVGKILEVLTEGQGLGQMQINLKYNIPIDKNKHCTFNVSVEVKIAKFPSDLNDPSNHLCSSCDFQCPKKSKTHDRTSQVTFGKTLSILTGRIPKKIEQSRPKPNKNKNTKTKSLPKDKNVKTKVKRSLPAYAVRSAKSYCMTVCIRHVKGVSGPVDIKVEMLTGFKPVAEDVKKIQSLPDVLNARITDTESATDVLKIQFSKISDKKDSCFALRIIEEVEAERLNPAKLYITEKEKSTSSCVLEYHPPLDKESLKVYCADFNHINRGECKCFSGLCSSCHPVTKDEFDLDTTKKLACKADVVYQLQLGPHSDKIHWLEINATVHSVNKTKGSHELKKGDEIVILSPSSCRCFKEYFSKEETFYFLSSDVDRLVNKDGVILHRYLLDENTTFLRVSSPLGSNITKGMEETSDIIIVGRMNSFKQDKSSQLTYSVPHEHLFFALTPDNSCEL